MASIASIDLLKTKGAWMNPHIRAVLMVARPWSIPASLVPAVLASVLVSNGIEDIPRALLPIFTGLLVHLAANCTNTLYDYKKGLDKPETADDRALVDATVGTKTVERFAGVCFGLAAATALAVIATTSWGLLWPVAVGFALAFFYTADPLSLKYLGLGDVTIFACFGPLLMLSVSGAVAGQPLGLGQAFSALWSTLSFNGATALPALGVHGPVLAMSIPIGVLTVNILHANNVRDVPLDREAGARTLPQWIGVDRSRSLYSAYFVAAYVSAVWASALYLSGRYGVTVWSVLAEPFQLSGQQWAQLLQLTDSAVNGLSESRPEARALSCFLHIARVAVFLAVITGPWCITLVGRMWADQLATLPQATAQFDLLFGAALVSGLLPLVHAARLWLGILFYLGGVNNVIMWHHTRLLVRYKLSRATGLGPYLSETLASGAGLAASVGQMAASAVFMLGIPGWTRPAAALLLAFILPVTGSVHDLWNAGHDAQAEYRDPSAPSLASYTRSMGQAAARSSAAVGPAADVGHGLMSASSSSSSASASEEAVEEGSASHGRGINGRASQSAGAGSSVSHSPVLQALVHRRGRRGSVSAAAAAASPARTGASPGRKGRGASTPKTPAGNGRRGAGSMASAATTTGPSAAPAVAVLEPVIAVPTFLDDFSNEFVHYFKNCGMAGGLLLYLALAPRA